MYKEISISQMIVCRVYSQHTLCVGSFVTLEKLVLQHNKILHYSTIKTTRISYILILTMIMTYI